MNAFTEEPNPYVRDRMNLRNTRLRETDTKRPTMSKGIGAKSGKKLIRSGRPKGFALDRDVPTADNARDMERRLKALAKHHPERAAHIARGYTATPVKGGVPKAMHGKRRRDRSTVIETDYAEIKRDGMTKRELNEHAAKSGRGVFASEGSDNR